MDTNDFQNLYISIRLFLSGRSLFFSFFFILSEGTPTQKKHENPWHNIWSVLTASPYLDRLFLRSVWLQAGTIKGYTGRNQAELTFTLFI